MVTAAIILILASMYLFGIVWVAVAVLGIMIIVLAISSTLTATVTDDALRIRFGPVGLIRKSWPMAEIASVTAVTNPWYYGGGIRWTSHGTLYNVSGYGAVEVRLLSGKSFRIGTDEPEVIRRVIEDTRAKKKPAQPY
jgi:phage-related holin